VTSVVISIALWWNLSWP